MHGIGVAGHHAYPRALGGLVGRGRGDDPLGVELRHDGERGEGLERAGGIEVGVGGLGGQDRAGLLVGEHV